MIEIDRVSKHFGGVQALDDVSFKLDFGIIHGLVGENGAGKSTMMKILAGVYRPDGGRILIEGKEAEFRDPKHAYDMGIRIVYQELSLIPDLTVAENLYLHHFSNGGLRRVNRKALVAEASNLLQQWGLKLSPADKIDQLPMGQRQLVEIAREVAKEGRVLILDEPTSSLTNKEIDHLFEVLKRLKQENMAIVFISHRLDEVLEIADQVTVFRNGQKIDTVAKVKLTPQEIVKLILGREMNELFPKINVPIGETLLSVRNLTGDGFQNISFDLHKGEILGIAGLIGAGRSELLRSLFGLNKVEEGTILLNEKPIRNANPTEAIRNGFGLLSESRTDEGVFPELSVAKNLIMMSQSQLSTKTWLRKGLVRKKVSELRELLNIVTYNPFHQELAELSGGNQQKVVIGRLLGSNPGILLLDEPTRGVDVGTKAEIHRLTSEFVAQENAIIMVSSDIPELVGMCDRIIVLYQGKQLNTFERQESNKERILQCAMGVTQ